MLSKIASPLAHLYPLQSGCGKVANSALFRWIDPPGGPDAIVSVTGGQAVVPAGDYVGRCMRFLGDIDPKVSWVVDRAVLPGYIALDIGSNLGLVALRMAVRTGPEGAVHAFEPQPRLLGYLRQTLELNPRAPIHLHGIALGTAEGKLTMTIPSDNAGAATLVERDWPGLDSVRVPVRRLDDYASTMGLPPADFIKMDVEGFEKEVLAGAKGFLEAKPPKVILLEENNPYPDNGLAETFHILQEMDYHLFGLPKRLFKIEMLPLAKRPACHDFVAIHRSCPDVIRQALRVSWTA